VRSAAKSGWLRRARRTAQAGAIAGVVLVAGCGSADEPEQEEPDPTLKQYDTFIDLYTHMVCDLVARCCNELSQAIYTFGGEQTCEVTVGGYAALSGLSALASVGAGDAVYHEDRQRACKAELESMTCEEIENTVSPPACEAEWFEGLAPIGSECHHDVECANAYCELPPAQRVARKDFIHLFLGPWPEAPGGTCVVLLGNGADCVSDAHCLSGHCEDDVCVETPTVADAFCPL